MNGPEHYREAERLICQVSRSMAFGQACWFDSESTDTAVTLAAAQVHATLALAAATVQEAVSLYTGASDDLVDWGKATAPTAVAQ